MGAITGFAKSLKGKSNISLLAVGGAGLDYYQGKSEYLEENPNSKGMATLAGLTQAAGWLLAEPLMWGLTLKDVGGALAQYGFDSAIENRSIRNSVYAQGRTNAYGERVGSFGGDFEDSQQAATLRQRQMNLLRQHRMSTQSILGSEARQLHR